ncbi:hypothetical protein S2091_0409 [Solimicrobium silvestre]|uniref:Uncharacterized protein n=1 Tax=Solimicrobium silvestre TaxID=2099400 RepID=A0A2S9H5F1_9BURK|nr:hypothetical protein S2091_0409 [Solimicrobium silvestre]
MVIGFLSGLLSGKNMKDGVLLRSLLGADILLL